MFQHCTGLLLPALHSDKPGDQGVSANASQCFGKIVSSCELALIFFTETDTCQKCLSGTSGQVVTRIHLKFTYVKECFMHDWLKVQGLTVICQIPRWCRLSTWKGRKGLRRFASWTSLWYLRSLSIACSEFPTGSTR